MRKINIVFVVLFGLTLIGMAFFRDAPSGAQGRQQAVRRQWEYKMLVSSGPDFVLNIDDFNAMGSNGWELCTSVASPGGMHFFFKRPKP